MNSENLINLRFDDLLFTIYVLYNYLEWKRRPHPQPLPVIPLRGTEGGQIGSSPPRTPPGERERVAFASLRS